MLFPTMCVDNFFDNPKSVRELALSLEYCPEPNGIWPGKRTKPLHEVSPAYNTLFNNKLFSLLYDFSKHNLNWEVDSYFQMIEPYGTNPDINIGWVHKDHNAVLAGVVYLNENPELSSGTSLFTRKFLGAEPINGEFKRGFFVSNGSLDEILYKQKLEENNNQFEETLTVNNVYNRMICYNGSSYHRANGFTGGNEPRLTQVFFVRKLAADWFPIPSMRSI
jgi:hypothetical protein